MLVAASTGAAHAQTPAGSAALARVVAREVAAAMPAYASDTTAVVIEPGATSFDAALARELAAFPRFRRPVADSLHAIIVSPFGLAMAGDTATVTVKISQCYPDDGELNYWNERTAYGFEWAAGEWRFLGRERLRHGDGRCGPEVKGG
jgi:hypothetical protein